MPEATVYSASQNPSKKKSVLFNMFKYFLLVVVICFSLCCAEEIEETGRKKHGLKVLYGGGLVYLLTFLAIKVKIVLVIGTIIAIAVFFGKIFAFFKYAKYFFEKVDSHNHHDENIVFTDPHSYGQYSSGGSEVLESPPTGYSDPHNHYARSIGNAMSDNIDIMKEIFARMDLTEYAFDSMDVKTNSCKKRFVCEADINADKNSLLALGMYMFSETGFSKYRSEKPPTSIEDCRKLYPDCVNSTNDI